jgi:GTP-binding protein
MITLQWRYSIIERVPTVIEGKIRCSYVRRFSDSYVGSILRASSVKSNFSNRSTSTDIDSALAQHSQYKCHSWWIYSAGALMTTSLCSLRRAVLRTRLRRHIAGLQPLNHIYLPTTGRSFQTHTASNVQSLYWDTSPPNSEQLAAASAFFRTHPPRKLWTATEWRKQGAESNHIPTLTPEVAFLGRSNVGKSSLLNAILFSPKLNHVGAKPGKTTTMHAWALSASDPVTGGAVKGAGGDMDVKLAVLDMPGYGHASHDDWGDEIITYLRRRKQLRRAFLLLDSAHGVKKSDQQMLDLLRSEGIPHQIIASKCDRVGGGKFVDHHIAASLAKMRQFLEGESMKKNSIMTMGEIIGVGALGDGRKNDKVRPRDMRGVQDVQWAILRATGLDEFVMKKLGQKVTSISPAGSLISEKLQNQVLNRGQGSRPPPIPKTSDRRSGASVTIQSTLPVSSAPSQSHGYSLRLSAQSNSNPMGDIASASASGISQVPKSSQPPSEAPTKKGKWVPNVGGMAELMAMSAGGKSGQQAAASATARASGTPKRNHGKENATRTRRGRSRVIL